MLKWNSLRITILRIGALRQNITNYKVTYFTILNFANEISIPEK